MFRSFKPAAMVLTTWGRPPLVLKDRGGGQGRALGCGALYGVITGLAGDARERFFRDRQPQRGLQAANVRLNRPVASP
jgi:hypothetical protein